MHSSKSDNLLNHLIGLLLFFLLLFLVVLPNQIETFPCSIVSANIISGYMSRKSFCACAQTDFPFIHCAIMLSTNTTGKCYNADCCLQSDGNRCEKRGVEICDVNYCMKTYIEVDLQYKSKHRMIYSDCEGDYTRCDLYNNPTCISQLQARYKVGDYTCYYRSYDDRLELDSFSNNSPFIAGVFFTVFGGIMFVISLICFIAVFTCGKHLYV
jgi:hypothetical protein